VSRARNGIKKVKKAGNEGGEDARQEGKAKKEEEERGNSSR
jgi:hypothetical protein